MLLCIYIGGVEGNTNLEPPAAYVSTLNDGVVWARCQFSGDSYGAPRSLQDIRDVYNIVCATVPVAGVVLVANSMGAMVALNAITHDVVPGVLGVYLTDPVTNLSWSFNGPRRELIRTAYGIAQDGTDYEEKTEGFDPNLCNWTEFKGTPIHIIGSTGDTMVPFASHGQELAAKLSPRQDVMLVTLNSAGHGSPDRFNIDLLREFLVKVSGISIGSTPPEIDFITSDSFNRDGELFGSTTDNFQGEGVDLVWGGTVGDNITTQAIDGGQLTLGSTAVFSQCVDGGISDVEVEFTLVKGPASPSGYNSLVDLRKISAATGSCLRLLLHSYDEETQVCTAQLAYRIGTTGTLLGETFNISDGQVIRLRAEGSAFSCYVDDSLVQSADVTDVPVGTFYGFGGSSNNQPWIVSGYSIKTI